MISLPMCDLVADVTAWTTGVDETAFVEESEDYQSVRDHTYSIAAYS